MGHSHFKGFTSKVWKGRGYFIPKWKLWTNSQDENWEEWRGYPQRIRYLCSSREEWAYFVGRLSVSPKRWLEYLDYESRNRYNRQWTGWKSGGGWLAKDTGSLDIIWILLAILQRWVARFHQQGREVTVTDLYRVKSTPLVANWVSLPSRAQKLGRMSLWLLPFHFLRNQFLWAWNEGHFTSRQPREHLNISCYSCLLPSSVLLNRQIIINCIHNSKVGCI